MIVCDCVCDFFFFQMEDLCGGWVGLEKGKGRVGWVFCYWGGVGVKYKYMSE